MPAPAHLAAAMAARTKGAPADKLDAIRNKMREFRDLHQEVIDLTERMAEKQARMTLIETKELVDLFNEAGVSALSIDTDGNLPAMDAERQPFYSARIPDNNLQEALDWLDGAGHGELIKTQFTIAFGMGGYSIAKRFEEWLGKQKIEFAKKTGVLPQTLTAFVKCELNGVTNAEEANKSLPLALLGAYVGEIVKVKPRKEKKVSRR